MEKKNQKEKMCDAPLSSRVGAFECSQSCNFRRNRWTFIDFETFFPFSVFRAKKCVYFAKCVAGFWDVIDWPTTKAHKQINQTRERDWKNRMHIYLKRFSRRKVNVILQSIGCEEKKRGENTKTVWTNRQITWKFIDKSKMTRINCLNEANCT